MIHLSWKSMALGMKSSYCKKGDKLVLRDFTDGSKVGACNKAWSVFFATCRKNHWDETKPRHAKVTQEAFNEAVELYLIDLDLWYFEEATKKLITKEADVPRWVKFARAVLKSKKISATLKIYWQKRLAAWEKKAK